MIVLVIDIIFGILILLATIFSVLCRKSKAAHFLSCLIDIYTLINILGIVYMLLSFYVEVHQNPVAGIGVIAIVLWGIPLYLLIVLYRVLATAIARHSNTSQPLTPTKRFDWLSNITAYSFALPLITLALGIILLFI